MTDDHLEEWYDVEEQRSRVREWKQRAEVAEKALRGRNAESIEENHAIYTMTGQPREGFSLQQEIRAQLEEAQGDLVDAQDREAKLVEALRGLCGDHEPNACDCGAHDSSKARQQTCSEGGHKIVWCSCGRVWPCPIAAPAEALLDAQFAAGEARGLERAAEGQTLPRCAYCAREHGHGSDFCSDFCQRRSK